MKILAAVDGTEKSLVAVQFASRLLDTTRDRMGLYFAPPQRSWTSYLKSASADAATPVEAFSNQVIADAIKVLPSGLQAERIVISGNPLPASGIRQAADAFDAELVVVGAGRSSTRLQFFVGGVARDVLHRSPRSVLACRQQARLDGPLRVLIAADPHESGSGIPDLLSILAWPPETTTKILYVMDYVEDERLRNWLIDSESDVVGDWAAAYEQEIGGARAQAMELLVDLQHQLPSAMNAFAPEIAIGHVVEQIVRCVEKEQIDLVVVGGRCRGRVSRLLGSTTEGLLLQAPASLLVVHAHDDPEARDG